MFPAPGVSNTLARKADSRRNAWTNKNCSAATSALTALIFACKLTGRATCFIFQQLHCRGVEENEIAFT